MDGQTSRASPGFGEDRIWPGGLAGGHLGTCMMLLGPGVGYSNVLEDGSSPLEDPGVYRQERGSNTQS